MVNEVYPAEATDVSSVLTRVRDANPDMLIGGSYLPDSVLIMRQSKELGVNPSCSRSRSARPNPTSWRALGADAEYVLGPSMWEPQIETPGNAEFVEAYQAKFDREPDYHSAAGYSACQVLEAAVTKVGEVETSMPSATRCWPWRCRRCCPASFRSTRPASRSGIFR